MTLKEWTRKEGRGSLVKLMYDTRISYNSLLGFVRGKPVGRYATARKISKATQGQVSIEELCNPNGDCG
jgi:hypothetical protein